MTTDTCWPRRRAVLGTAAVALFTPHLVRSQGRFPERPIRLLVPWPAGGSSDLQMRSISELAGRRLGQPVVVENRPGAAGTIHAPYLAREARPDGYTIGQMNIGVMRRPALLRNPAWDPVADFTPIIQLTGWLLGVVVRGDSPIRSWADYIAAARANPGRITVGTPGVASGPHITMEEISRKEGMELTHVPFRGSTEIISAMLSGQIMSAADSSSWTPHVEAGQMRLLCVWSAQRAPRFPDVPTIRELGYDIDGRNPYGLVGPKGMDAGVVLTLHDAFKEALFDPADAAVRAQFDMLLEYLNPDEYRDFIVRHTQYERDMVRRLNLRID